MKHILIVEDEKNIAELLRYNLEADGYRVSTFGEGAAALEFLEQEPVDLVVLDLMLPGMSGYAVCEALRAQEQMMPIMILSARTLAEDRARGFEVGADQYLQKPFDLDEFLIRVKSLLAMYQRRIDTTKTMELTTDTPTIKPKPLPAVYTFWQRTGQFRTSGSATRHRGHTSDAARNETTAILYRT